MHSPRFCGKNRSAIVILEQRRQMLTADFRSSDLAGMLIETGLDPRQGRL